MCAYIALLTHREPVTEGDRARLMIVHSVRLNLASESSLSNLSMYISESNSKGGYLGYQMRQSVR